MTLLLTMLEWSRFQHERRCKLVEWKPSISHLELFAQLNLWMIWMYAKESKMQMSWCRFHVVEPKLLFTDASEILPFFHHLGFNFIRHVVDDEWATRDTCSWLNSTANWFKRMVFHRRFYQSTTQIFKNHMLMLLFLLHVVTLRAGKFVESKTKMSK